jgi:phosphoadenosine phosphosulfate reductase
MMLKELTLTGEIDKVEVAMARLRLHEPLDGYYVAFSGGKDSCVVLDLCRRAGVKYDAHYNLTTVDPPELVQFIRREYPEAWDNRKKPEMTMWQLIVKKRMPPTRLVRYCCQYLKEGGRHWPDGYHWHTTSRERKAIKAENAGDLQSAPVKAIPPSDYRLVRG